MNVGFVGAPCSGKTTTAALSFAALKDEGVLAEFVSEHARLYIARKRFENPDRKLVLSDEDQVHIMREQTMAEHHMRFAVGNYGIVISDASPLNALLYMSEKMQNAAMVAHLLEYVNKNTDLLFFAQPVIDRTGSDPNRLHNAEQSVIIHKAIKPMLAKFAPHIPVIEIVGSSDARKSDVLRAIYDELPI